MDNNACMHVCITQLMLQTFPGAPDYLLGGSMLIPAHYEKAQAPVIVNVQALSSSEHNSESQGVSNAWLAGQ